MLQHRQQPQPRLRQRVRHRLPPPVVAAAAGGELGPVVGVAGVVGRGRRLRGGHIRGVEGLKVEWLELRRPVHEAVEGGLPVMAGGWPVVVCR